MLEDYGVNRVTECCSGQFVGAYMTGCDSGRLVRAYMT